MSVNVLRQKVKIVVTDKDDNKEVMEYPVAELKFKPKRRKNSERLSAEEYKALEALRTRVESPNLTIKPDVVIKPDERIDGSAVQRISDHTEQRDVLFWNGRCAACKLCAI